MELCTIKGTVTAVHPRMLVIEIDHSIKVHLGLLFLVDPHLPTTNSEVTIESAYCNKLNGKVTSVVVSPENYVKFECTIQHTVEENIAPILKSRQFLPKDYLVIAKYYDRLLEYFNQCNENYEEIIISLIRALTNLHQIDLEFPSDLNFIDTTIPPPDLLPFWTFGNHINWKYEKRYLFGEIACDFKTGSLYLIDNRTKIRCIILNCETNQNVTYYNSFVVIKNFCFITETFTSPSHRLLYYLIVHAEDIIQLVLESERERIRLFEKPKNVKDYHQIQFSIIGKFRPFYGSKKSVEHWIRIRKFDNSFLSVLVTPGMYAFLQNGKSYCAFCPTLPVKAFSQPVNSRSYPSQNLVKFDPLTKFMPDFGRECPRSYCTVEEALESRSKNMISFEGVISYKKFINPIFQSYTAKVHNDLDFDCPGDKTHIVVFSSEKNELALFLNNWENLSNPVGLLPNMRVRVHNVLNQRSYWKCTILTTFELLSYDPPLIFETANLYGSVANLRHFYFGLGRKIPNNTIIFGKVLSFSILGFRLTCNEKGSTISITLIGEDQFGKFKIMIESEEFLPVLFGCHVVTFKRFSKKMRSRGQFLLYSKDRHALDYEDVDCKRLQKLCTDVIPHREYNFKSFQCVCRKMEDLSGGSTRPNEPVYYYLRENI